MTTKSRLKNRQEYLGKMAQMLICGDLLNFEILFKKLFEDDNRQNRLPQFYNHWKPFASKYSKLIPNKIIQYANMKHEKNNNESQEKLRGTEEINNYLLNVSGEFFLKAENISFLKSYLTLITERAGSTKTEIPITQMYQVELVVYFLLLRNELEKKDLIKLLKCLPQSSVLSFRKKLAKYLDMENRGVEEKSRPQKLDVKKESIPRNESAVPSLDRAMFLEISKSNELSLREKLDLLIMSENYKEALRLIEISSKDAKSDLSLIVYIVECLLLLRRFGAIEKVAGLLPSFIKKKSEKRFYLYLLKRLLIQRKKYSSSRSVGKLIRRI